jgi:hypothetical protein
MEQQLLQLYPVESTTESTLLPNNSSDTNNQKLNDVCMQTQQLIQAQSLQKPTPATSITKPTPATLKLEEPTWKIARLWYSFKDPVPLALSYCTPIEDVNPSTPHTLQEANRLGWGIRGAINKAILVRNNNDSNNVDSLLKGLRTNTEHSRNIHTITEFASKAKMSVNEDVLTDAYKHLVQDDINETKLARQLLEEIQKRFQDRKACRRLIHDTKHVKEDIGYISDDEYDFPSIFGRLLNYSDDTTTPIAQK